MILLSATCTMLRKRGSIVLHKKEKNGAGYIQTEYVDKRKMSLPILNTDVKITDNTSTCIPITNFSLLNLYNYYSPHIYIEPEQYNLSVIKTYRAYFGDFMKYHKRCNMSRLNVADIKKHNNLIIQAKEYKSLSALSCNEVGRILSFLSNQKHHCMISLIKHQVHAYMLRHSFDSFAAHLLEQGTNLRFIQELQGYNDIKTTLICLHAASIHKSNSPNQVQLLEIRKHTCQVSVIEISYT